MAIEQLGESLLAQARQKSKKREKKAKLFTGAMLGVLGGNMYLRSKAKKRVKEINESFQPVLDTHVRRFNEGVDFWSDFNNMLRKQNASIDTWKEAYFNQELKKFKAGQNFKDDFKTEQEIRDYVREQIKDDQAALQNQLDAYSEFKHYTKSKDDKTRYLRPINKALKESQTKIANNANVGSSLLKALGLKEKDHLQRIISGDTSVTLEGVTDQTADKLAAFLSSQNQNRLTLEKSRGPLSETVYGVQSPDPVTLESFYKEKEVERFKIDTTIRTFVNENIQKNSAVGEKIKLILKDPNNTEDFSDEVFTETLTFHDLYSKLEGNEDSTEAYKFQKDFIERASRKAEYEKERGNMPDYLAISQETLNELGQNFILEEKTGIGYNLKYKQSTIEEHIVNSGGPQTDADFNDIDDEMTQESVRKEFQEGYNNETDPVRKEFIFEQAEKAGITLNTDVEKEKEEAETKPSVVTSGINIEQFKIKPEYEKALTELSERNVEKLKSSFDSFVSNIEEGTNNMFNAIEQIDISEELQERLIAKISKTIMPILKGDTIPQKDFADAIKDFARENNLRLEDIVSAIDYPWLYEITGIKNRNIGREQRQKEREKIKQDRLRVESLIEYSPRVFDQFDQTGFSSLLQMREDSKEEIAKRKSQLSNRGTL
tara:strand:+ start:162 stop:2138 length:1977 start_codon:yes stop_codon:yes gene_type:complete